MRLSACYIVKDETEEFALSLRSLQDAVTEIIVVMTAESPETAEIANKYHAITYEFPWQNDFSAARNFALDKVNGDWVIFLDADEYFLWPDKVGEAIAEVIAREPNCEGIFIERREIHTLDKPYDYSTNIVGRIFQNLPHLRYQGIIHEMMMAEGERPLRMAYGDERLIINHTGYEGARIADKIDRNRKLLEQDAAQNGKKPWHSYYLADCYYGLGEYAKALQETFIAMEAGLSFSGQRGKLYHRAVECMRQLVLPLSTQLAMADLGVRYVGDIPDFYGERGMILCAMGRLEEARASFVRAIELYKECKDKFHAESSIFSRQAAARVYHRLGEIYLILDDDEKIATEYFNEAFVLDPDLPEVQRDYEKYCRPKVFLTACYIVRDEEKNIAKSLASIKGQVEEIIVVDTGSRDNTIAIAKEYGAKVIVVPWNNDFAAARNEALTRASGEWIVFLDADEYFSPATMQNLRSVINEEQEANLLMVYMQNIDIRTGESLLDFYAPRIFRNLPGLHYTGRIHEQLRMEGQLVEPVHFIRPEKLTLLHTGYSPDFSREKGKRNLVLLLKEVEDSDNPELLYMYLAETYDGLGDNDLALYYAKLDIDSGKKNVSYASRSYKILLRILAARPAQYAERRGYAVKACEEFPELPEFHADLAECLAYEGDFAAAIREAEMACELFSVYQGVEPCMFTAAGAEQLGHRRDVWQAVLDRAETLNISACLITTNEERDLPGYLNNVAAFAQEIIIVDGGSTDKSLAIIEAARQEGADIKLISRPWDDDFAAARNAALENATGDWAVVMDTDERMVETERVLSLLAFEDITCPTTDALMVPIINIDEDDEGRELYRFPYTRFVRLGRGLSYQGRIHEQLIKEQGNLKLKQENYRLHVTHTGYSAGRMQRKLRRNLDILRQEIAETGEQPRHLRYLAETYFGLGRIKEALRYALDAIGGGTRTIGTDADMYYLAWQCMAAEDYLMRQQYDLAEKAAIAYPHLPEFWGIMGLIDYEEGKETACQLLRKAIALWEKPSAELLASATSFGNLADEVYGRLAALEAGQGHRDEAERLWQRGFAMNRHNTFLLDLFSKWQLAEGKSVPELGENIAKLYSSQAEELTYLTRFAENYGYIPLQDYYMSKRGQSLPPIYEMASTKGAEEFFIADILPAMVKNMQDIPMVLVALEQNEDISSRQLLQKCARLLPAEMYNWWLAYYEGSGSTPQYNPEITDRFRPAFAVWGSKEQLERLEKMADNSGR